MTTIKRVVATMMFAVLVTVSAFAQSITASPASLTFTMVGCDVYNGWPCNSTLPPSQLLQIGANLPPNTPMILTSSMPLWMDLSPGNGFPTAPLTLQVSIINTWSPLAPGTYTATLRFDTDYGTVAARSVTVPIFLIVTAAPPTVPTPPTPQYADSVYFNYKIGDVAPAPRTVTFPSQTPQATGITVRASQPWILVSLTSTSTPTVLTIGINPVNMGAGSYSGVVDVMNSVSDVQYLIYLTITAPIQLTASPSSLSFSAVQGGGQSPTQFLQITASVPNTWIYKNGNSLPNWLLINGPSTSATPLVIPISVTPLGLAPGTYSTNIGFYTTADNATISVPITFVVAPPPPVLQTTTNQLQFQIMIGNTAPTQSLQVSSSGTVLTASISLSAPWLTASPLNGTTPFTVNVGVNPAGVAVGTYRGQVVATTTGVFTNLSTQTIDVTLTVTPDNRPVLTSVVNAASFKSIIGPGAWISLMGHNLAPSVILQSVPFPISLDGVSAELQSVGGVFNLFIEYASPTQINAFVPQNLPVSFFGTSCSVAITVPTGTTSINTTCQGLSPALFSYGTQQYASATHLDGSVIGVIPGTRPAQNGEIITLWGTGFGQTAPAVSDVNSVFAPQALANSVAVYVGGQSVQVLWAGMVGTGLDQFNIQLPDNLTSGDVPISIKIGGTETERVVLPVR